MYNDFKFDWAIIKNINKILVTKKPVWNQAAIHWRSNSTNRKRTKQNKKRWNSFVVFLFIKSFIHHVTFTKTPTRMRMRRTSSGEMRDGAAQLHNANHNNRERKKTFKEIDQWNTKIYQTKKISVLFLANRSPNFFNNMSAVANALYINRNTSRKSRS